MDSTQISIDSKKYNVFLALPSYGTMYPDILDGIFGCFQSPSVKKIFVKKEKGSLLCAVFNKLWCKALNSRNTGKWDYFTMMHSDIEAEPSWLTTLIQELRSKNADIMSTVVPIKDKRGLTSTGVWDNGVVRRFTMKELATLPETFCLDDILPREQQGNKTLVINTGLWICDFTKPWVEKVCFQILDMIDHTEEGTFVARSLSEDWNFSLWAKHEGLKVYCTRKPKVAHHGESYWTNFETWGTLDTDTGD